MSLIYGSPGDYKVWGVPVEFERTEESGFFYDANAGAIDRSIAYIADSCLKSRLFHLITFGYLHILVHEVEA